jgi:hypothetical protein
MRLLTLGLLGAAVMFASPAGADTKDEARDAFKEGVAHYEAGRTEAALEAFRTAYELQPSWKIHYNIGQCEASLKRYGLAVEAFEAYMAGAGDEITAGRRDQVIAELDRLRKLTGLLDVEGPDGLTIIVDGYERGTAPLSGRLRVVAGVDHQLVGQMGDAVVARKTVRVGGGESVTVVLGEEGAGPPAAEPKGGGTGPGASAYEGSTALEDDGDQGGVPALFWVGAGLTVAAAGTGVGFSVAANSRYEDFESKNKQVAADTLPADDKGLREAQDDVETYDKVATAMFITAGVLAAATAVVLIVHLAGDDDEEPDEAEVSVAPNGLVVSF